MYNEKSNSYNYFCARNGGCLVAEEKNSNRSDSAKAANTKFAMLSDGEREKLYESAAEALGKMLREYAAADIIDSPSMRKNNRYGRYINLA